MIFDAIPIGHKKNVAYLVGDTAAGEVAVIDGGFKPELIFDRVKASNAKVSYILATHHHLDHFGAAAALKQMTGGTIAAYKSVVGIDRRLDDGDVLHVGTITIEVIHTPGHTADSICFLVDGRKLMTGDTLYVGRVSKASTSQLMRVFFDTRDAKPLP